MKVLFLTIGRMNSIEHHGIYPDLLRCFREHGHEIFTVSPYEKRTGLKTNLIEEDGVHMLHVSIGNITNCNLLEKGISTLQIESKFLKAIRKYYSNVKFDLVLYSTPPITFVKVISYIKKRDNAKTYLLLKDIFPQNAVDLGMMAKTGVMSLIYKYFRNKEKELYSVSDWIGCMSPANVDYILKNNPEIKEGKVKVCPNSIEIRNLRLSNDERILMREKYGLPKDKKVFVYGGNLGKPQGITFLIECLKTQKNNDNVFFFIVGDGTEYGKIECFFNNEQFTNMKLMKSLPKEDYDRMIAACDVGMIFLDYRFSIPNFPSRLLTYMQAGLPVFACTDTNTDIGKVITEAGFGWWCKSDSVGDFVDVIELIMNNINDDLGVRAFSYLEENYSVSKAYRIIMENK